IARILGAEHRGPTVASGGYFGALQLVADVAARLRVPAGGGRPTDPSWTERRQIPLAPRTLKRLERLAARCRQDSGTNVEPRQLAGLLLERAADGLDDRAIEELAQAR